MSTYNSYYDRIRKENRHLKVVLVFAIIGFCMLALTLLSNIDKIFPVRPQESNYEIIEFKNFKEGDTFYIIYSYLDGQKEITIEQPINKDMFFLPCESDEQRTLTIGKDGFLEFSIYSEDKVGGFNWG